MASQDYHKYEIWNKIFACGRALLFICTLNTYLDISCQQKSKNPVGLKCSLTPPSWAFPDEHRVFSDGTKGFGVNERWHSGAVGQLFTGHLLNLEKIKVSNNVILMLSSGPQTNALSWWSRPAIIVKSTWLMMVENRGKKNSHSGTETLWKVWKSVLHVKKWQHTETSLNLSCQCATYCSSHHNNASHRKWRLFIFIIILAFSEEHL